MGFRLETATGRSIAVRATKKRGASSTINLEELLAETPSGRAKWIQDRTDRKLTTKVSGAARTAETLEGMHAAIDSIVDKNATPDVIRKGAMILQPSLERRRSGSHYTPRELTELIVRRALEPILERILTRNNGPPLPEQILALKVCDPAAGSGAFLVEACRQLGSALVSAWHGHGGSNQYSSSEDEITLARRIVARRCIYGVDRNLTAVDLAKLSLWLLTLSKDQPLTFVDHAIRHGDSLVGLNMQQIEAFHWNTRKSQFQAGFESMKIRQSVESINTLRELILDAPEGTDDSSLRENWKHASMIVDEVRLFGDLIVAAFFVANRPKHREFVRSQYAESVISDTAGQLRGELLKLRHADPPIVQFHWEIEFPEVFGRPNPGFDVVVGNPPFAGKNTLAASNVANYADWLRTLHPDGHGNSDLVAYFFRRSFDLIRAGGTFGLIATNTIAQGDTRATGLRSICNDGGTIYHARRRFEWPGLAAVVISIVHIIKGEYPHLARLDGRMVERISAYLFHTGSNDKPLKLLSNNDKSFQGDTVLGMGFTFDDTDTKGVATSIAEMQRLLDCDERNAQILRPYIGGREVNSSPSHTPHRYVINFRHYPLCRIELGETYSNATETQKSGWLRDGAMPFDYPEPVASDWPDLLSIVEKKVKPKRLSLPQNTSWNRDYARHWWQFAVYRIGMHNAIDGLDRVLVTSITAPQFAFTFLPSHIVLSNALCVFSLTSYQAFGILQSRIHEIWARFFGSSFKDDSRYTNTECFETFPLPDKWEENPRLNETGKTYFEFRASLMIRNDEGMTQTYNRFHDPDEHSPDILRLRDLHRAMDRATLDAYGWSDISTHCEFLLDYEMDEVELRNKKKPYRYRWPDDVRGEVLGRLLELNAQRAAKEGQLIEP